MKKIFALCLIVLLLIPPTIYAENTEDSNLILQKLPNFISLRQQIGDVIIIPDNDPFFGIIGSYLSCWYGLDNNSSGLLPLLVQNNQKLTNHQELFLNQFLKTYDKKIILLGEKIDSDYDTNEILGDAPTVSLEAALHSFTQVSTVLILPYDTDTAYEFGLTASPLASYLNIPIIIYDNNQFEIQNVCNTLNVTNAYVVGDTQITLPNITITYLETKETIQNTVLTAIKNKFSVINYITLTNPSDTVSPYVVENTISSFIDRIRNIKSIILGKEINLIGSDTKQYNIIVPNGINRINIHGKIMDKRNIINSILYMYLYDSEGNIVAYSNSFAYNIGETYLDTLTCNASGNYTLVVKFYHGLRGGYFIQRGFSFVNTDFEISVNISKLNKPHMPLIPNLSIMAPYLTSSHGGIIVADSNFELTSDDYTIAAEGSSTGPWYNESLHIFTNEKVNYTLEQLEYSLSLLDDYNILDSYLNGPAWLAIIGGTNMIPMYYYGPSQAIPEKGLPSDNPYSLDWNLSVGRVIGWNAQDVSLLISRTLFYKEICGEPNNESDWHKIFSFVFGEGFGETGGIFHQIPYAFEIKEYGFKPRIFGDFRNSRQLAMLFETYTGSNYIELISHADWFWFAPSLYGLDTYSKAIDVAHVKDWIFSKPSLFMTSACLMGRTDGISPTMSIGLTLLHAGCNCFIGATRETGSEAGLTIFENHMIIDNYSVGEALRGEKRIDKEIPNYYVRTLYGDPAFNPYEPNNGFSNQGRPVLI